MRYAEEFFLVLGSVQYHGGALEMAEWRLCEPRTQRHSTVHSTVSVVVRRAHEYYVYNICTLLGGVSALSTLAFTCDLRANGERLGVNVTLLLTAIAFKQLISEQLPKISYLTLLDRWMLCCLLVLFLATIACVLPSAFPDEAAPPLRTALSTTAAAAAAAAAEDEEKGESSAFSIAAASTMVSAAVSTVAGAFNTAAEVNLAAALFTFVLTVVISPSYLYYSLHQVKDRSPILPSRAGSRWYIYDFTDALWFLREDRRVYYER